MSKKAKKTDRSHKRAKSIITALSLERDNFRGLYNEASEKVVELQTEVRKVSTQSDENGQRSRQRLDEIMSQRGNIDKLKVLVADLERAVAERDGTVRELRRQIDQAAPKVMVKPAVWVSPQEAGNPPLIASARDLATFERASIGETTPKKHWTAL